MHAASCPVHGEGPIYMSLTSSFLSVTLPYVGEISTHISGDTVVIKTGIGEKLGMVFQTLATFVTGFAIGFSKSWKLSLVILSVVPVLGISMGVLMGNVGKLMSLSQTIYGEAGAVAEESLSSIRSVAAFASEKRFLERYAHHVDESEKVGIQSGLAIARGVGVLMYVLWDQTSLFSCTRDERADEEVIQWTRGWLSSALTPWDSITGAPWSTIP